MSTESQRITRATVSDEALRREILHLESEMAGMEEYDGFSFTIGQIEGRIEKLQRLLRMRQL